ncbi:MAG: hypothetical protein ACYTEK_06555 [Planctomycetota bacterium]
MDSSGYDFDPKVVDALVSWIQEAHNRRGSAEQLALETLLDSEPQLDDNLAAKRVAEVCATDD